VKGLGYAQYMSLREDGAWAEFVRAAHVTGPDVAAGKLRHMWGCHVFDEDIADLRTPATAAVADIDPEVLVGSHEPCQEIAAQLVDWGYRGVLSPNAALEGVVNLTLFGPRHENHLTLGDRFDPRYVSRDVVEVRLIRPGAQPPNELIPRVRPWDAPSSTYAPWPNDRDGLPRQLLQAD
jgi:hypothetical protein